MEQKIETIGYRIKMALDARDIKQKDLAKILGVTQATVSSYISGKIDASVNVLLVVAKMTGFTLDWLITGKEYGTEISAMVTGEAPDGVGPTDEEMKDIPAAFQEVIREGRKLPLAKQYRFAADALEKIAEYEAEEIKKREREERED